MSAAPRPQPKNDQPSGPPPGHPAAPPYDEGVRDSIRQTPAVNTLVPAAQALPVMHREAAIAGAAAHAKAEIETRYLFALQRPRDFALSTKRLYESCERPGFAEEAMYARPVGQKKNAQGRWEQAYTEGLSIRFAEEAVRMWGNLHVQAPVVEEDADQRVLRVTVTDLEVNVTYAFDVVVGKTVERRALKKGQKSLGSRTNSYGDMVYRVEATDDDVLMKQNALASKAIRTGVLRLIPADVQAECERKIQATNAKSAKESGATDKVVSAFASVNVAKDHLEGYLGHSVDAGLSPAEFANLRGIFQAIKDGETTWADVVASVPQDAPKRNPPGVKNQGYEQPAEQANGGKEPPREVIDMADKPKVTAQPEQEYGAESRPAQQSDLELDREIEARERAQERRKR